MLQMEKIEYFRDYKEHRVAKYSVQGKWVYVVWMDKDRLYQCDSYTQAKEWIDGAA